jgi:hypothetical protein
MMAAKKLMLQHTTKRGNLMKKLIAISLLLTLVLSLAGCAGGVDMEQADTDMDAFFQAVAAGDFTTAQSMMHPSITDDLQAFFNGLEDQNSALDFQNGMTWEREMNIHYSWYHSDVGGSQYMRSFRLKAGDVTLRAEITIVSNKAGYGIYSLYIQPTA